MGVNVLEVALLAGEIVEDGFSWPMVSHATCIEERPGAGVIQEFNEKLVADTDLAPVEPDSTRYGSFVLWAHEPDLASDGGPRSQRKFPMPLSTGDTAWLGFVPGA